MINFNLDLKLICMNYYRLEVLLFAKFEKRKNKNPIRKPNSKP